MTREAFGSVVAKFRSGTPIRPDLREIGGWEVLGVVGGGGSEIYHIYKLCVCMYSGLTFPGRAGRGYLFVWAVGKLHGMGRESGRRGRVGYNHGGWATVPCEHVHVPGGECIFISVHVHALVCKCVFKNSRFMVIFGRFIKKISV